MRWTVHLNGLLRGKAQFGLGSVCFIETLDSPVWSVFGMVIPLIGNGRRFYQFKSSLPVSKVHFRPEYDAALGVRLKIDDQGAATAATETGATCRSDVVLGGIR